MRIVRLQAEGFKRLVAVDITPEGDLIEVRGENGNGKSSVLDAIFAALGGAEAAPEQPVREGEDVAIIRLDLGDLIVTRFFTAEGTTRLKVTAADGATYTSGQTMLDKLVGAISFDPLEFLDLKPAEQAEELRKLVTLSDPETGELIDLDAIATERKRLYDERRDVNRDGGAVKARIEAAGGVRHVPDDAPDRDAIVARLAGAAETNSAIERERSFRESKAAELDRLDADLDVLAGQIVEMQRRHAEGKELLETGRELLAKAQPLADPVDVAELSEALARADVIEENRRANAARQRLLDEFETLKERSVGLTAQIAALDERRAKAIAAAKMPVDGLALVLGEDGLSVTFGGVPFSQASDAERLRVSAAVAMAANPELRVLRLKNASLLDKRAVETLREMATSNDFQIWAEFVGDEGPGIIMESGEVRGAPAPEPLERPRQRKKAEAADATESEKGADASTESVSHGTTDPDAPPFVVDKPADKPAGKLFADDETPTARKPRAMTEFVSKPRS
jgi:hypothetical protein